MLLKQKGIALLAIIGMATSCVNEELMDTKELQNIEANLEVWEDPDSRVSVDAETLDGTMVWYWNPTDEIGVFTNRSENNLKYVNTSDEEYVSDVYFMPETGVTVKGTPR